MFVIFAIVFSLASGLPNKTNEGKAISHSTGIWNESIAKIMITVKDDEVFLEDWLKYHVQVFGAENIYVFDDRSDLEATKNILNNAVKQKINVVYANTSSTLVPVTAFGGKTTIGVSSMSAFDGVFDIRRIELFNEFGNKLRDVAPLDYIMPVDVDEFVCALDGITRRMKCNREAVSHSLHMLSQSSSKAVEYYASSTYNAQICNPEIWSNGGLKLHPARVANIDFTHFVNRTIRAGRLAKKFVRARAFVSYEAGGHSMNGDKTPPRASDLVLIHYAQPVALTLQQRISKLEQRFDSTGWASKLKLSGKLRKNLSWANDTLCKGLPGQHYCKQLMEYHRYGSAAFKFKPCDKRQSMGMPLIR